MFSALRATCSDLYGILGTFSDWQWSKQTLLIAGQLNRIPIPTHPGVKIFATNVTPQGIPPRVPLLWARVIKLDDEELVVSAPVVANSPGANLGTNVAAFVSLSGHTTSEFHGWATLLFESLTDYSEMRVSLAVFKLATALQLATDRTLEMYLNSRSVDANLSRKLLKGTRQWHARIGGLSDLAEIVLDDEERAAFGTAAKGFLEEVRVQRNQFAHDHPDELTYDEATRAFETCFPLFWGIDRIQDTMTSG